MKTSKLSKVLFIIGSVATLLGALMAGVDMLNVYLNAESAAQQGAGAAMALTWVVIPYCVTRLFYMDYQASIAERNVEAVGTLNQNIVRLGQSQIFQKVPTDEVVHDMS